MNQDITVTFMCHFF